MADEEFFTGERAMNLATVLLHLLSVWAENARKLLKYGPGAGEGNWTLVMITKAHFLGNVPFSAWSSAEIRGRVCQSAALFLNRSVADNAGLNECVPVDLIRGEGQRL